MDARAIHGEMMVTECVAMQRVNKKTKKEGKEKETQFVVR